MVLLSHPTGNTFARAVLEGLVREDMLALFATTIAVQPANAWSSFLPKALQQELHRREFRVPSGKVLTKPLLELLRLVSNKLGLGMFTSHETGIACTDAVYRNLDEAVAEVIAWKAPKSLKAVYAYEDGALASFRAAKAAGIHTIYDLPIAYWETTRRLMDEESERLPEWEPTLMSTRDSREKFDRKTRELELADLVFCPSQFVLDSIPDWAKARSRCRVVEFGTPALQIPARLARKKDAPLRVLFAGTMTQRKGLADLFAAFNLLDRKDVELVVMGSPVAPMEFYRAQCPRFIYETTRPHAKVLELMTTCDVLALPSIVEGRALVQQEAMACGLPIFVTRNAGAEDLVEEGQTGWLAPIRSPQILAAQINWMADNRAQLESMREPARAKATRLTWDRYRAMTLDEVHTLTGS